MVEQIKYAIRLWYSKPRHTASIMNRGSHFEQHNLGKNNTEFQR